MENMVKGRQYSATYIIVYFHRLSGNSEMNSTLSTRGGRTDGHVTVQLLRADEHSIVN